MKRVTLAALLVLVTLPVLVVVGASPAAAAIIADGGHSIIICNATIEDTNGDGDWFLTATEGVAYHYACQVPANFGTSNNVLGLDMRRSADGAAPQSSNCMTSFANAAASNYSLSAQKLRVTYTFAPNAALNGGTANHATAAYCNGTARTSPFTTTWEIQAGLPGFTCTTSCTASTADLFTSTVAQCTSTAGNGAQVWSYPNGSLNDGCATRIERVNDTQVPLMPTDYYAGGNPTDPDSGYAHGVECGGNTFRDSEGGWWAALSARDTQATVSGSLEKQAWFGSWDTEGGLVGETTDGDADNRLVVPLPPAAARPDWGWVATFRQRVELPVGISGRAPVDDTGTETDGNYSDDDDGQPWWVTGSYAAAFGRAVGYAWSGAATAGYSAVAGQAVAAVGIFALSYWSTTQVLEELVDDDTALDPVELGPAAKGFSPQGARFVNSSGDNVGSGQTFVAYELTCSVMLVPNGNMNNDGTGGTVDPPNGPAAPSDPEESENNSECNAGRLGDIPIIGGIFDGFYGVLCGLGNVLGRLLDGLWNLLVPDELDFAGLLEPLEGAFPFNIGADLIGGVTALVTGLVGGIDAGDECPVVDVGSIMESGNTAGVIEGDYSEVQLALPTPASAGCETEGMAAGAISSVGDLFGFASVLRSFLLLALYVGFAFAVVRAVTTRDPSDLEVGE